MSNAIQALHPEHHGGVQETYNPTTGGKLYTYRMQSKKEAEQTIDNAHEAFKNWRKTSMEKRAEIISEIGTLLKENKSELAKMMAENMGKPISEGQQEVDMCATICGYTAGNGPERLQDEHRKTSAGRSIVTYQPMGVILAMQPWNFPLYQVIRYSVANLLAGNTTVLKHAPICWKIAERIQDIFSKAGVPENVFSLLYVTDETVDTLIDHPHVRGVTLTGSAKAGKIVGSKAGNALKKSVLELGGSDPYIILEDADIDKIIPTCVQGRINNAGQTCVAAKRFIVVEEKYEEFKEKFVEAMKNVKYGNPMDENTQMGPLARRDLRENLHKQVQDCLVMGATCLTGGKIPEDEDGNFYPATVLEDITPEMPAYKDELFGPVAALFKAKDAQDACRIANDHRYGLGGGIFTADEKRGIELARTEIDTGMINVNCYALAQPEAPFGGVKDSGYGREHGGFGVREFVNVKTINMPDE